jgi:predicted HTH transcriptional regulator
MTESVQKKGVKEEFAKFFESPDRVKFRDLLKNNTGEYNHLDFKAEWIEQEPLAKAILGFANSKGGAVVFGVKENNDNTFEPTGLASLKEKTEVKKSVQSYLPEKINWDIHNFEYNESEYNSIKGKKFQVLIVEDTPHFLPFLSLRDGTELKKNRIYYRGKTNTEEATYEQVQEIISRRIDTSFSTTKAMQFRDHLNQLKELYEMTPENYLSYPWLTNLHGMFGMRAMRNPLHPEEGFDEFISKMIKIKKEIIQKLITGR